MKPEERRRVFDKIFGPDEMKFDQQEKCIESLPLVKLKMEVFVPGEEDIVVGDILTCKLRVDYRNLKKKEQSGYVHSKHYPYLRRDTWYLIVTDNNFQGLAAVEKLNVEEDFFEKEYKERITRPGPIDFTVILVNDCYKGLDQQEKHSVIVFPESYSRKEIKYRKADLRAIKDTAVFFKKDPDDLESDSDEKADKLIDQKLDDDFNELLKKLKEAGLSKSVEQLEAKSKLFYKQKKGVPGLPPPLYSNTHVPETVFLPADAEEKFKNQKGFEKQQKTLVERRQMQRDMAVKIQA
mmetsp:Transcript_11126/g.18669  ORF Transcript_11126/g.18669 Transcript_11126/m.18669 type:complete len:294 (+) Transcript_11126:1362-2243(+)